MREGTEEKKKLDSSISTAIKGVAILLMLVHHGWGLPAQWFEPGLGYGQYPIADIKLYELVGNPTKICVSVFAFLTGYGYFYKQPTFKYGLKKVFELLAQYWIILFVVFYPAGYIISEYRPLFKEIILNIFSIHNRAVSFSWYVLFYVLCMCSLPILVKLSSGKWWVDIISLPLAFTLAIKGLEQLVMLKWYIAADIKDYFYWMPVVWIGYIVAKYGFFDWLQEKGKAASKAGIILLILVPIMRGFFLELFSMNLDVVYAPLFVYACLMLLKKEGKLFRVWHLLGKYSLYIWLFHSIFFWERTRSFFQPLVYRVNQPVITILLLLVLSLGMAVIMNFTWKNLLKIDIMHGKWRKM